jgi:microtubule-associated serine/threonine kinase
MDRYNHDLDEDTDEMEDSPVFGSFSSCSSRYRVQSKLNWTEDCSPLALPRTPDIEDTPPSSINSRASISGSVGSGTALTPVLSAPESSQTEESDEISPQVRRRRRLHSRDSLPRFSISVEDDRSR